MVLSSEDRQVFNEATNVGLLSQMLGFEGRNIMFFKNYLKDREEISIYLGTSQMFTMAWTGSRLEPEARKPNPGLLHSWQELSYWSHHNYFAGCELAGSWKQHCSKEVSYGYPDMGRRYSHYESKRQPH